VLILSPLVGLAVGGFGAWLMGRADARFGIRHEYQSLYGIGLVLAAYASAQLLDGDGFLASFFAGLAVTLFNLSLCDCFLEYGEVTAEMAMLLAFILFGAVLSTLLGTIPLLPALALALIVIGVARPIALGLVLQRATMSNAARAFIGWFGPRGLNSLLLALLVVQAGVPDAERLLAITGTVVLVSVIVHGASTTPLSAWYARRVAQATLAEEREATATGLFQHDVGEAPRISVTDLATLLAGSHPPIVLDVRTQTQYDADAEQIPGSLRAAPDQIEAWADKESRARSVVTYCSLPSEATSACVARQLIALGFDAAALEGGYSAWRATQPVEPKRTLPVEEPRQIEYIERGQRKMC
jgi:NhaP-type Na+/H+ or K+/H+ antiporter